jgi:hypothetical protein
MSGIILTQSYDITRQAEYSVRLELECRLAGVLETFCFRYTVPLVAALTFSICATLTTVVTGLALYDIDKVFSLTTVVQIAAFQLTIPRAVPFFIMVSYDNIRTDKLVDVGAGRVDNTTSYRFFVIWHFVPRAY